MLSILPTSHANSITSTSSKKKELSRAAAVANRSLCSLNRHGLPLSAFRVSSGSRGLAIRKLSVSMCLNGRGKSTPGFEVNAALKYSEDQPEIDVPVESYPTLEPVDGKLGMDMNDHEEGVSEQRKGAKIHDFCLGIPFGGIVFCGGVVGFLFSRNPANLLTGILSGGAILALGILSLKVWREGKSSLPFILGQAAIAATLFRKHFQLYPLTKKLFPSGFYIVMSVAMLLFYSYVLIAGGNPPPKKKLAASPSP